jgi:hypothetical protein
VGEIPIFWEIIYIKIMEISSVSISEYILVCASYLSILRDEKTHKINLKDRGYKDHQIQKVSEKTLTFKLLGLRFKKHLTEFEYKDISFLLMIYDQYKNGVLPENGCMLDQSSHIIELMTVLQSVSIQHEQNVNQEMSRKTSKIRKPKNG